MDSFSESPDIDSHKLCVNGHPLEGSDAFTDVSTFGLVLGIILILGGIAGGIPQHIKLLKTKSSFGISMKMLFLLCMFQVSNVVNAIIMKFPQIKACGEVSLGRCSPSLLSFYLVAGIWLTFVPIMFELVHYHRRSAPPSPAHRKSVRNYFIYLLSLMSYTVIIFVLAFVFMSSSGICGDPSKYFAHFLGYFGALINAVIFIPQIVETWQTKSAGSLSLLMLFVRVPGAFIQVGFMVFVTDDPFILWLPYLVGGSQQLFLLILALIFTYRERRGLPLHDSPADNISTPSAHPTEKTHLLHSEAEN